MTSTSQKTKQYIKENPDIKSCLKKGLINHSSLARTIAKDLDIENQTSKEAILVASRRYEDKLSKEINQEKEITKLLSKSSMEVKNKITVFTLDKKFNIEIIEDLQKEILGGSGVFYILEGSDNYTLITQQKYEELISKKLKDRIIKQNKGLVLVNFISPKEIQKTKGVISFLTSLFAENGINIVEFFSCWTDTLFVIDSKDLKNTMDFLNF